MADPGLDVIVIVSAAIRAILVVGAIVVAVKLSPLRRVGPGMFGVVERLGRYHRVVEPGLRLVLPVIDRVYRQQKTIEHQLDLDVTTARAQRRRLEVRAGIVVRTGSTAAYATSNLEVCTKRLLEARLKAAMRDDDAGDDDAITAARASVADVFAAWGCTLVSLGVPEADRRRLESQAVIASPLPVAGPSVVVSPRD